MARLFGFIGNRQDIGAHALKVESKTLVAHASGKPMGWGFGFYQAGEVLLRRRPLDEHALIDVASLTHDVRTDVLIGHVRQATVGEPRARNTHPFRYRQWLFAHTGTVAQFDNLRDRLMTSIPDFLLRNVRGDTDSELLFYLFLSFLHDAGKLSDSAPSADVTASLRATLALVDQLSAEEGALDSGRAGMLVSNGDYIAGLSRNSGMAFRIILGHEEIEALLPDDGMRKSRVHDLARVRFTLIASDFDEEPAGWQILPERCTVVLGRYDEPAVETF